MVITGLLLINVTWGLFFGQGHAGYLADALSKTQPSIWLKSGMQCWKFTSMLVCLKQYLWQLVCWWLIAERHSSFFRHTFPIDETYRTVRLLYFSWKESFFSYKDDEIQSYTVFFFPWLNLTLLAIVGYVMFMECLSRCLNWLSSFKSM